MTTVVEQPVEQGKATTPIADYALTGPDTLGGRYMRRFWHPIAISSQLPAGQALPLRLMSEDFTLYRGAGGTAHVVGFRCAHRGTQLSTGWVEDDCVRCLYHGWKYDASGQCVEQPAEDGSFAAKVRIPAYPTEEYLGLIWTYIGEGIPPPFRRFPQLEDEGEDGVRLTVGGNLRPFNFVNDLENDPAHVPFVHRGTEFFSDVPRVRSEETEYGSCETVSTEERGDIGWVHRIFPNARLFAIALAGGRWAEFFLWLVPVDDQSHRGFGVLMAHNEGGRTEQFVQAMRNWRNDGPNDAPDIAAKILRGEMRLADVENNAMQLVQVQDIVAQWGQGTVRDRVNERLGRSDIGVILLRKIWDRELRAIAESAPITDWRIPNRLKLDPHYHG